MSYRISGKAVLAPHALARNMVDSLTPRLDSPGRFQHSAYIQSIMVILLALQILRVSKNNRAVEDISWLHGDSFFFF